MSICRRCFPPAMMSALALGAMVGCGSVSLDANESSKSVLLLGTGNFTDCDSNGIPDDIDLDEGNATDCNQNGVLDSCDIAGTDQWASTVMDYSSQFAVNFWSAQQVLGEPDVFVYGDVPRAWAPHPRNGSTEFVQVAFDQPVFASGVTVRETFGNGMVFRVELLDVNGDTHVMWEGVDPSPQGQPFNFRVDCPQTPFLVSAVTVHTDTDTDLSHWEELDAIALHGVPAAMADCNQNGLPDECDADFDGDGVPDECELSFSDCNSNGVDDGGEIASGSASDCNGNLIPDDCDIAGGSSGDCDADGVPDECNEDRDDDGLVDGCDVCPDSDTADTINVGQCQTGVANGAGGDAGCTMADDIALCQQQARNHGQFVHCVVRLSRQWEWDGWIGHRESARIRSCVARSNGNSVSDSPHQNTHGRGR